MQGKNYTFIITNHCDLAVDFSFKMSLRTLKNIDYFESYLKFKKSLKFALFLQIPSSKFNETTSFWTNFKDNFDGSHITKSKNCITHRIKIKII